MIGRKIPLVIISGLSGAGKSAALNNFEDSGFFCIDNLPPQLLLKFIEICAQPGSDVQGVALGMDIRNREFLSAFFEAYDRLKRDEFPLTLLFFEARSEVLIRRFSESRRPHPLAREGVIIEETIASEREKLARIRERADEIIDTSDISRSQLKETIIRHHVRRAGGGTLQIVLLSFGFKLGLPYGIDLLFDVRFLRNPYFQMELREQTGHDKAVQEFIAVLPETEPFLERLMHLLDFLIPQYQREGKSCLTIGVGCTGGRHRSVAIVHRLHDLLQKKEGGYTLSSFHRDVHRPTIE